MRWRARGALSVTLYQDGLRIPREFHPSDEYTGTIQKTTQFQVVAAYGKGESAAEETQAVLLTYGGGGSTPTPNGAEQGSIFKVKPEQVAFDGTPNGVFNDFSDRVQDDKITGISSLAIAVDQVMAFRKLSTALPLLARLPLQIDQRVAIQTGEQYVELAY